MNNQPSDLARAGNIGNILVRHHLLDRAAIEDAEGYDGGHTWAHLVAASAEIGRVTDPTTDQPLGEWLTHDDTKPDRSALRYRGKLAILLDIVERGKDTMRVVKCIRCVAAYFRRHRDVQIRRWMIVPD